MDYLEKVRLECRESDAAAQLGKRTYTREQIKALYEAHRAGAYAGRELAWQRQEADFCRAMRDGRIVDGLSLLSKSSRDLMR